MASLDYILVNSDVCVLKGLNGLRIVDARNSQSMIELKNVKKAYVSKTKRTSLALNDVSFVLPDKGFVYALGKSG